MSEHKHSGQSADGGKYSFPHLLHLVAYTFPCFKPSQNFKVLLIGISWTIVIDLDFIVGIDTEDMFSSSPQNRHVTVVTCAAHVVGQTNIVFQRNLSALLDSFFSKLLGQLVNH